MVDELLEIKHASVDIQKRPILRDISIRMTNGERIAIMGPSGSGKSTLLYTALGLLKPNAGEIFFQGQKISLCSDSLLAKWRRENIGIVFQFGHLTQELTISENIQMPLLVLGKRRNEAQQAAENLLSYFGLSHLKSRFPYEISGGESQRVAVARSVIHRPKLIFADEPTGALDSRAGSAVLDLLIDNTGPEKQTGLLMVTHDPAVASKADRIISVRDGTVVTTNTTKYQS